MIIQVTVLFRFSEATIQAEAAIRFNQSIITYFYIIITCFNLLLRFVTSLLCHFYLIITY